MLQTLVPVGSRMAKKTAKIPQETEHPRFKAGVPAMKRRAVLQLSDVKAKLQEIRDQLAMIDQCIMTAEGLGVDSLYLDGATKPDLVSQQLFLFRARVEEVKRSANGMVSPPCQTAAVATRQAEEADSSIDAGWSRLIGQASVDRRGLQSESKEDPRGIWVAPYTRDDGTKVRGHWRKRN